MIGWPSSAMSPIDVQDLVADELVVEPQRVVQHAGLADDDRVLERTAERQPLLTQLSTSFRKAKVRAGAISSTNDSR